MSDSMQLRACIAVKFSVQMETALMVQWEEHSMSKDPLWHSALPHVGCNHTFLRGKR
jgi:hypothetical protein